MDVKSKSFLIQKPIHGIKRKKIEAKALRINQALFSSNDLSCAGPNTSSSFLWFTRKSRKAF